MVMVQSKVSPRWSDGRKILEAFILSRRNWYSSLCGAVENLLDPPGVEDHGDYFLLVHSLQPLLKKGRDCTFGDLCSRLAHLGYARAN